MKSSLRALAPAMRWTFPLLLWIGGLAARPASALPPAGSYLHSCSGVSVTGTTLTASCKTRGGSVNSTSLADYPSCIGDIANFDGALGCSKGSPPPDGSYRRTCRDFFVAGNVLKAECKDRGGSWQVTSLENFQGCTGQVSNIDGFLTCHRGSKSPPQGSYRQTCRDLWFDGSVLRALCKARGGDWTPTTLNDVGTCRGALSNQDGVLSCAKGDADPPAGSYRQTCREISFSRGVLSAACRTRQGQWTRSELNEKECAGDIANDDGSLKCSGAKRY
jgi:hypothetical protein